ncbi:hypothetical protein CVT25_014369 [Psilocybe cyanescens]|uniref:Uncharacterized protein n=1 Tax=Psilocybe cyanescens TaxID=93625 RepID=A0A409XPK5_PSICY|nr:hypothetical protein CVT25_014369 [Psilocybe cyanescens]
MVEQHSRATQTSRQWRCSAEIGGAAIVASIQSSRSQSRPPTRPGMDPDAGASYQAWACSYSALSICFESKGGRAFFTGAASASDFSFALNSRLELTPPRHHLPSPRNLHPPQHSRSHTSHPAFHVYPPSPPRSSELGKRIARCSRCPAPSGTSGTLQPPLHLLPLALRLPPHHHVHHPPTARSVPPGTHPPAPSFSSPPLARRASLLLLTLLVFVITTRTHLFLPPLPFLAPYLLYSLQAPHTCSQAKCPKLPKSAGKEDTWDIREFIDVIDSGLKLELEEKCGFDGESVVRGSVEGVGVYAGVVHVDVDSGGDDRDGASPGTEGPSDDALDPTCIYAKEGKRIVKESPGPRNTPLFFFVPSVFVVGTRINVGMRTAV